MQIPTTPIEDFGFVPGQNISAETFPEEDVLAAETLLAEEVAARRPELDLSRNSTLHDLLIRGDAISYLLNRRMLEAFRYTMSLKGIEDNPELASGEVIDAILSNYLMTRDAGEFATGWLMITVSSSRTNVVQQGTRFNSTDGYTYLSEARTTAVDGTPSSTQTKLYSANNGTQWYYYVQVKAEVRGSAQNTPTSTGFTCDSPISDLVYISVGRPFSGGRDGDSIESLSASVIQSLSVRNLTSRASVAAELPRLVVGVLEAHAVGSGHPMMIRGKSNVIGVPIPGHVDVYIKSSREPSYKRTTANAIPAGDGTWTAELGGEASAGVTDITAVRPSLSSSYGTFQIEARTRTFLTSVENSQGDMVSPNLVTAMVDCAGSVYQRCSVTFSLSGSDLSVLGIGINDTFEVEIESLSTEYVPETHIILTEGNTVPAGYDMLVKPFIPCVVSFDAITVSCDDPSDTTLVPSIRTAIASFVNATAPGSPMLMDGMVAAIRGVPGTRSVSLPVKVTGTIILPDEAFSRSEITSLGNLAVINDPALGIGRDNVAFMIGSDDINVNLTRWTT